MKPFALLASLAFAAPALLAAPSAHADAPSERSPALATGLALAPSAVGAGLIAIGIAGDGSDAFGVGLATVVVGPSLGHIYAGSYWRAAGMIGLRTAGLGLVAVGAIGENGFADGTPSEADDRGFPVNAGTVAGLTIIAASAIFDIHDAPAAARRYNQRQVAVAPTVLSSAHGAVGGLAVVGQF